MKVSYVYYALVYDFSSLKCKVRSFGRFFSLPALRSAADSCTLLSDETLYVIRVALDSSSVSILHYDFVARKLERLNDSAALVSFLYGCLEEWPFFKR